MTRHSIDELRRRYVVENRPLDASVEQALRADNRVGARTLLALIEKRRFENRSEGQRLRKMLRFETHLWDSGRHAVAGVDEAGMSPLAGPVSAAAVVLKPGTRIVGIDDSKKLDSASREELAKEIKEKAAAWNVAFVEVEEIDTINIYWAGLLAMQRAVQGLRSTPQHLLIDAKRLKEVAIPQQAIIKGDAKSASIAAASILAKVTRDAVSGRLTRVIPVTALPIIRATLCELTMPHFPGLVPVRPIDGRSGPYGRSSACRPGPWHPNGSLADRE